ncbi:MAG: hypothetical protein R3245_01260 [Kiloniellales bacterium]|nr:hypothetical protein [Kiloniellales bacterium]
MSVRSPKTKFVPAFLLMLGLQSCAQQIGQVTPPADAVLQAKESPLNEGKVARKSFWQEVQLVQPLSFCYSGDAFEQERVLLEAADICKGGTIEFFSEERYLRECPLFQPRRVTYICTPNPSSEGE